MRMTRAALRAQAQDDDMPIHEDTDTSQEQAQAQDPQDTQQKERPALKDITQTNSSTAEGPLDTTLAPHKKAKSRKKAKNTRQDMMEEDKETCELQPTPSPAASQATVELEQLPSRPTHDILEASHLDLPPAGAPVTEQAPEDTSEVTEHPVRTPQKEVLRSAKTPKFDPLIHMSAGNPDASSLEVNDDSFVDSIKSRSPSKLSRESAEPDSFVENITSRTPARRVSRIEDSVEAMDALEDAIEEISGSLPKLEHLEVESHVNTRKLSPPSSTPLSSRRQSPGKATTPAVRKTVFDPTVGTKTPKSIRVSPTKAKAAQLKSAPTKTTSTRPSLGKPTTKAPAISRPTGRTTTVVPKVAPKVPSEGEPRPQMSFTSSPAKQQPNVMKKRVTSGALSTSKPAFVPTKSSKPPTTSNFTLPGEAIAAKLKAQREERAKKEGENAKPAFKARPAPSKVSRPSVLPRETKASQARLSAIRSGSNKENVVPRPVPTTVAKPSASLTVTKTRPDTNKPNSSVRRTTATPKAAPSAPRASLAPRVASQSAGEKLSITKDDAAQQKIKGREVYGRLRAVKEAAEKERREKEEAAKKARADAAERGRQASREWAEKQKRKLAALKAENASRVAGDVGAGQSPAVAAAS